MEACNSSGSKENLAVANPEDKAMTNTEDVVVANTEDMTVTKNKTVSKQCTCCLRSFANMYTEKPIQQSRDDWTCSFFLTNLHINIILTIHFGGPLHPEG